MTLAINARFTTQPMGGQQRFASEISSRLSDVSLIAPSRALGGTKGHLWEQCVLPLRARGRLLWSPSTTGPVLHGRQVVTVHDVAFLDIPECFSANFVKLYGALMPPLLRRAQHVVTVSEFSRGRIMERYRLSEDRVSVIYNGISAIFRPYEPAAVAAVRARLGLPDRYLLLQATADRRKNLAGALAAWGKAQTRLPEDLELVVTGRLASSHVFGKPADLPDVPRVRFLGFVDDADLGPLFAGALCFLFPSVYEGFGLPIIESFACGTPVITSTLTAMPEVAGDGALLVDPHSEDDIANAMVRLATDPRLRTTLAERGLARSTSFSWRRAADQYAALFATLR